MKKVISLILSVFMCFSLFEGFCSDSPNEDVICVYVSASKYGEFLTDKNGEQTVCKMIELSGGANYTLDHVFAAFHDNLYEGGSEDGYETAVGDYGLYVTKFWGDTSGNFTYQMNFGKEDVYGLDKDVKNGDYVEFFINKSFYPDTESYAKFEQPIYSAALGESLEIALLFSEYSADGLVFLPCGYADITIDGDDTSLTTNEDGVAVISFDTLGTHIVSARKGKTLDDGTVPAISAPFCLVEVSDSSTQINPPQSGDNDESGESPMPEGDGDSSEEKSELLKDIAVNIAKKHISENVLTDENMYWLIADFCDFSRAYPEIDIRLEDEVKQKIIDKIIDSASSTNSQGDLAKAIITLRSMGYDAENTVTEDGNKLDIVQKLTSLITEESVGVPYYEYTLPYVIIALGMGENYASSDTLDFLLDTSIQIANKWMDTTWGTDAISPMLVALSPYCGENEQIHTLVTQATELMRAYQGENGSMGNAASTGIAMWALCAVGEDPSKLITNDKNLIDGLLAQVNENCDGFIPSENSFATEQGFRAIVALKLFENDCKPYDFCSNPMVKAKATRKKIPAKRPSNGGGGGSSSVKDEKEDEKTSDKPHQIDEALKLPENKHEDVKLPEKVSERKIFADITNHPNQTAIETLAGYGIINGRTETEFCPDDTMTRAEFATIVVRSLGLSKNTKAIFHDVLDTDWFSAYVNTAHTYGIVNGVSDTQFNPYGKISRQEAATMLTRAAVLCGMKVELDEEGIRNILSQFTDYRTCAGWAAESMAFCYSEQILNKDELEINPDRQVFRAEIADMVFNVLKRAELI